MPIPGIPQPEVLDTDDTLRLRRYDGQGCPAWLAWYQDPTPLMLVDGKTDPQSGRLEGDVYLFKCPR